MIYKPVPVWRLQLAFSLQCLTLSRRCQQRYICELMRTELFSLYRQIYFSLVTLRNKGASRWWEESPCHTLEEVVKMLYCQHALWIYSHVISYISALATVRHYCLPSQNCTTAHLPLQAHFLAPLSPPPPSVARNSSSFPLGRPTITSALLVRRAKVRMPDDGPSGPMASANGVVGSHMAFEHWSAAFHCKSPIPGAANLHRL